MNDQSVKADEGKLQLTLVPREMIRAVAAIRIGTDRKPEGRRSICLLPRW